jgi:hypothetical protein
MSAFFAHQTIPALPAGACPLRPVTFMPVSYIRQKMIHFLQSLVTKRPGRVFKGMKRTKFPMQDAHQLLNL